MPPESVSLPPKIDLEQFKKKSDATLHRLEKISFGLLAFGGLLGYFFFRQRGLSVLLGGSLGMFHFRALHRMSQRRFLAPKSRLNTQFFYSLKLFFMLSVFFWLSDQAAVSTPLVIAGFFLSTIAVLIDGKMSTSVRRQRSWPSRGT